MAVVVEEVRSEGGSGSLEARSEMVVVWSRLENGDGGAVGGGGGGGGRSVVW